jgi:hypothetical protein
MPIIHRPYIHANADFARWKWIEWERKTITDDGHARRTEKMPGEAMLAIIGTGLQDLNGRAN